MNMSISWQFFDNFFPFINDLSIDLSDRYKNIYLFYYNSVVWYNHNRTTYWYDNDVLLKHYNMRNKKLIINNTFFRKPLLVTLLTQSIQVSNTNHFYYKNAALIFAMSTFSLHTEHRSDFMNHLFDKEIGFFFDWK